MTSWMFPGQGSQKPGMAAGISACKELFETARAVTGIDLEPLCVGQKRVKWTTEMLQPAVFITSYGVATSLKRLGLHPSAVIGHSLGELTALTVAGCLKFEDALRVVRVRSDAMSKAARRHPGGMAAVIGLDPAAVQAVCDEVGDVWPANFNSSNQVVISGTEAGLTTGAERCRTAGARRVLRLDVPIAAHTPMMEPARVEVEKALGDVDITPPAISFFSTVDAARHGSAEEIRVLIARGVTEPVRFQDTIEAMDAEGSSGSVEVGPGSALCGLVRDISPDAPVTCVGDDEQAMELMFSFKALARA